MKTTLLFIFLLTMSVMTGVAQENTDREQRKSEKQQARIEEQKKAEEEYNLINACVRDSSFVFTANRWIDPKRGTVIIDPYINFLTVRGENVFFQFGLDNAGPGINGLGGASFEGKVVSYKYYKGKNQNKSSQLVLNIKPDYLQGTMNFIMTFYEKSATVDINFYHQRIRLDGRILPADQVLFMGGGKKFNK